jgi:hypothetical protein
MSVDPLIERAEPGSGSAPDARPGDRFPHVGALLQMLLPWTLGTAAQAGVDRAKWSVALQQAVRQLLPVP